jgi:hypothetical protein
MSSSCLAAMALFGEDNHPNRRAARVVVLRPHDAGHGGGRPDRYAAVGSVRS